MDVFEQEAPGALGFICRLTYIDAHLEAARRLARGERQVYCAKCERWVWVGECHEHPAKVRELVPNRQSCYCLEDKDEEVQRWEERWKA